MINKQNGVLMVVCFESFSFYLLNLTPNMKKKMIWLSASLVLTLGICVLIGVCWLDEEYVEYSQLTDVGQFVSTHFPNAGSVTAVRDFPDYDVWIGTGTEFDFWKNRDEISAHGNDTIPASILVLMPSGIFKHVSQYYNNDRITKINKEGGGYEIELANRHVELKSNKIGQLISIDD